MRSGWVLFFILLSSQIFAAVKPSPVLIRRKDSVMALSLSSASHSDIQEVEFNTQAEKDEFLRNLNQNEFDVEDRVTYRVNEMSYQEQVYQTISGDPLSTNEWSLFSVNNDPSRFSSVDIAAIPAWQVVRGGEHILIYIWDTGIEMDNSGQPINPDLRGRVVWAYDALSPNQLPNDLNGHGTHVASIAAAKGQDQWGMLGVVPGAAKLGIGRFLDAQAQGDSAKAAILADRMEQDIIRQRQLDPQVKILWSNSWGGGYSRILEDKVRRFGAYDVLAITSAGNDNRDVDANPFYPCRFHILTACVGATNQYDIKASFSSWGLNSVHLFAPGVGIYGMVPGVIQNGQYTSRYFRKDGTSQAVPHVTGVAALVWAANPSLSAADVQRILVQSVDLLPSAQGRVLSGGRLNAYRAVLMATGQNPSLADRREYANLSANSNSGGCAMLTTDTTAPGGALFMAMILMTGVIVAFRLRVDRYQLARARQQNGGDVRSQSLAKN